MFKRFLTVLVLLSSRKVLVHRDSRAHFTIRHPCRYLVLLHQVLLLRPSLLVLIIVLGYSLMQQLTVKNIYSFCVNFKFVLSVLSCCQVSVSSVSSRGAMSWTPDDSGEKGRPRRHVTEQSQTFYNSSCLSSEPVS